MNDNTLCSPLAVIDSSDDESSLEHVCWDPKDGELCLSSLKPWETMVEEQRVSDVQIDPQT